MAIVFGEFWLLVISCYIIGDISIMAGSSISWNWKRRVPTMAMYQCAVGAAAWAPRPHGHIRMQHRNWNVETFKWIP